MPRTNPLLVEKCRDLRKKGFTLGEIIKIVKLPKTTTYDHVRDIFLSDEIKQRLIKESAERLSRISRERKGKCIPGRVVNKPEQWSNGLIFLVAHFMFDGEIGNGRCVYQNRSIDLVNRTQNFMRKLFSLTPYSRFYQETGVYRISYYYVELAIYMSGKAKELRSYIKTASFTEKKIFLRAFFDDEGCAYTWGNNRKIRGYQHNLEDLNLIGKLLEDFGIKNRIEEKNKEIVISGRGNFLKFRNKINFSKGVCVNPKRSNSIWKKKLEKREILNKIIDSYQRI